MGCFQSLLKNRKKEERARAYAMPLDSGAPSPAANSGSGGFGSDSSNKYKGGAIGSDAIASGAYKGGAIGGGGKPGAYKGGALGSDAGGKPGAYKGGALGSDTMGGGNKPGAYKGGALGSDMGSGKPGAYKGGALGSDTGGKPGAYKGGALGSDTGGKPGAYKGGALGSDAGGGKPGAYKGGALGSSAGGGGKNSWEQGPKLDPKDYMFKDLVGETRVKLPGSVAGQQFIIENCRDCDLYVMDYCAMVTIDDCVNCRIFVGPTESSIFIRDCTGCKCVFICRQYRTRACKALDTLLLCNTRPVIETSTEMRFGCYDFHYANLAEHLKAVKMSEFANFWSHIFDFTPAESNWAFLPEGITSEELLGALPEALTSAECMQKGPGWKPLPIVTHGDRPLPSPDGCWVVFAPGQGDAARAFLAAAAPLGATLLRANAMRIPEVVATSLLERSPGARADLAKYLSTGADKAIALELAGDGCLGKLKGPAAAAGAALLSGDMDMYAELRYLGVEG